LEDKTLSQETKMENVRVAEKLKTIMRTAREKILNAYDGIDVSIKSKEQPLKTDMSQQELKQTLLELQQQFDREIQKSKLKDTTPATFFGNVHDDRRTLPVAEAAT